MNNFIVIVLIILNFFLKYARGDQSGMDLEGIRRPDASGASRLEVAQPL